MQTERDIYLLKLGEIWLKGSNKSFFEKLLRQRIRQSLKPLDPRITMLQGRFFLSVLSDHEETVSSQLSKIFGIVGFSRTHTAEKDMKKVTEAALEVFKQSLQKRAPRSFKIEARRSDKSFPLDSYGIACSLGSSISEKYPDVPVDVKHPDLVISVEVRDKVYIYGNTQAGPGGLPTGCAGKGILLLSGGIDSPAAGYMMAKRGLYQHAVYFHAYPYTSDEALEKVKVLASILASYQGSMKLHSIPFTEVQLHIKKQAKANEVTLHLRYAMVRAAEIIAEKEHAQCLVTGEALSQVASQTLESISFTNSASSLPVFRPLIGLDKEEIIRLAEHIGTYEISILPYEDCCTIFSPKHPLVKPERKSMEEAYRELMLEELISAAADQRDIFSF